MNSPGPSDRRVSLDLLPPQRLQTSFALKPSVATLKRKHTDDSDSLDMQAMPVDHHHIQDDDSFVDSTSSQPPGRKRLRQWIRQDGEFSPLLYMSPAHEQDENYPVDQEATRSFNYPQNTTDPLNAIRRFFHSEHDLRILRSNSTTDRDGDHRERRRSNSANSFAQVALASIPSELDQAPTRLSTLQDFSLPRPFEDIMINQPSQTYTSSSSNHSVPVHERGLDAPPSFFLTLAHSGQRTDGGALASRGPASLAELDSGDALVYRAVLHPLDTSTSASATGTIGIFLDKPLCESPESMNSDEYGRARFEFPMISVRGHVDGAS
ncbi:hypothetical protein JVU11DRAFT_5471 [Chiua virens]|nr:hypothetical protein JVU11DRAFT_5471 [Chiua virens]